MAPHVSELEDWSRFGKSTQKYSVPAAAVQTAKDEQHDDMNQPDSKPADIIDTFNSCVHHVIRDHVRESPEAAAVCAWDGDLSYKKLDIDSSKLAAHLISRGVGPETFVPICLPKSYRVPVAILAVMKAGGAFVLLDTSQPVLRMQHACTALGATLVIASTNTAEIVGQLGIEVVMVDEALQDAQWTEGVDRAKPDSALYAIFTSGTSGEPKGVVIEHSNFCNSAMSHASAIGMTSKSRVLQFASYTFDGCVMEILTTLIVGACICIPSEQGRRTDLAGEARRLRPNWGLLTPSVARIIDADDFPTLSTLVLAGEAVLQEDVRKWAPRLDLFVAYGPSECSVANTVRRCRVEDFESSNIGFAVGVACWIVDPDDPGRLMPAGAVGELLVEGPSVGRGYIYDPERTASVFIDAPKWLRQRRPGKKYRVYRTGDLARQNGRDGSICYIGRKDTQVKFSGQRLEVGEVEHHLRPLFPLAKDVAVDVVKMDASDVLAAFVVQGGNQLEGDTTASHEFLIKPSTRFREEVQKAREKLQSHVMRWMIPSHFFAISRAPQTPNHKIDRRKMRSLASSLTRNQAKDYAVTRFRTTARYEPMSPVQKKIQKIWSELLKMPLEDIGLDDSFFSLGASSIDVMKFAGAARRQGLEIAVKDVYDGTTLAAVAASTQTAANDAAQGTVEPFSLLPGTEEEKEAIVAEALTQCRLQGRSQLDDMYPCTPLQEGLMSLSVKTEGAYTVAVEYDLPSNLDIKRFTNAWRSVAWANPVLRTRIVQLRSGATYQAVVGECCALALGTAVSTTTEPATARHNWKLGEPLVYLGLHPSSKGYVLRILIHHALTDGWAMGLVLRQVDAAYHGAAPAPQSFSSFIKYVVDSSQDCERFWKATLADLNSAVFPRLPSATHVPAPTRKQLLEISTKEKLHSRPAFSIPNRLRLAWAILVSIYTDNPDVLFGVTVTGRGAPVLGIESMTGPTIATIPFRLRLPAEATVAEALDMVHDASLASMPFEQSGLRVISRLGPEYELACQFQSLLVVQPVDQADTPAIFGKLKASSELATFSSYSIQLICQQLRDSVQVDVTFDPDAVEETQLRRMLLQFRHIFDQLTLTKAEDPIGKLNVVSAEDMADLKRWNQDAVEAKHFLAHDLIEQQVVTQPNAPAVSSPEGGFSYTELDAHSSRLASHLIERGVGPEVFVAICFEKSRWTTVAMLGILKAAGAFVLLDPQSPVQRLQGICKSSKAAIVVTSEKKTALARELGPPTVVLSDASQAWASSSTCPTVPHPAVHPENPMYAVFTSESAGVPKGIVHSHISWCTSALANRSALHLEKSTRVLQFAPYTVDTSISDNLLTLVGGGCICVPSQEDLKWRLADVANNLGANWAFFTPSVARTLDPKLLPTLRTLVLGGEPIPLEVISRWSPHARILNVYGSAECAILTTVRRDVRDDKDLNNVGFSTSATTWIVDPKDGSRLAPVGSVGELLVESPIVGHGYINNAELTAASFVASTNYPTWLDEFRTGRKCRLYHTGDLVRYGKDGSLEYMGRKDMEIKLHGQRIELGEVQAHLKKCFPEAEDLVVDIVQRTNGQPGAVLTAFALLKHSVLRVSDSRFQAFVQGAVSELKYLLPRYMVPTMFIPVNCFPYSLSGKLDRKLLRELAAEVEHAEYMGASNKTVDKKPASDEQTILHRLFATVLKTTTGDLSLDSNFFHSGGDSISAMHLVALGKEKRLIFTTTDVFKHPTISSLAKVVKYQVDRVRDETSPFSLLPTGVDRESVEKAAVAQCGVDRDLVEDCYPCTPLQEGLMAHTAKTSGKYISRFAYRLHRSTEPARFQEAWNKVLRANPILRTRIIHSNGRILQVVLKRACEWKMFGDVKAQMEHARNQTMNLGTPLVAFSMAPSDEVDGSHQFVWVIHHSLYDGWSVSLLWKQVEQAYGGESLAITPFAPFIRYVEKEISAGKVFWESQLAKNEAVPFPSLPAVEYVPKSSETINYSLGCRLPSRKQHNLPMMIQLAWAIVCAQYTGSNDVVFGLTLTGRNCDFGDVAKMTGPTISTVPMRVSLCPDRTVDASLSQLREQNLAMLPFQQHGLHNIRKISPDSANACAFQTHLIIQPRSLVDDAEGNPLAMPLGEDLKALQDFASYCFVMYCRMEEVSGDLNITANYDPTVLQKEEVQRMLCQLGATLQEMAGKPEQPIQNIEILSKTDREELRRWNGLLPPTSGHTVIDLILRHAEMDTEAQAVNSWDGSFTYGELEDWSRRLARSLPVQPRDRIALYLEKSCWSIVAFLAVLRAGCTCVLLDPGHPKRRTEDMIQRSRPRLVLCSEVHAALVQGIFDKTMVVSASSLQKLAPSLEDLPTVLPREDALIFFTSGSTGVPKGIVMDHGSLGTSILANGPIMNAQKRSRILHFASYSFDASIFEIFMALAFGGCLCILSEMQRVNDLAGGIRDQNANWAFLTPSALTLLRPQDVPSLTTLVSGGEQITGDAVDTWVRQVRLINAYGPAEASFCCTATDIPATGVRPGTIGRMVASVGWIVNTNDSNKLAAIGTVGELLVEGPNVTCGYLDDPERTAAAYITAPEWLKQFRGQSSPGRLYKTGDLVQYNPDGTIRFVGRKDTQVKLRGQRIELGEIEYSLRACIPDAAAVVCDVLPRIAARAPMLVGCVQMQTTRRSEESSNMFCKPSKEFANMARQVLEALSRLVPPYMVPKLLLPLELLPVTRSGKTDRRRLLEGLASMTAEEMGAYSTDATTTKRPPRTSVEKTLHKAWAKVLKMDGSLVGLDDNFFLLGGDSITAMSLTPQLRAAGYAIGMADIFKHPILGDLAAVAVSVDANAASTIAPFALVPGGSDNDILVGFAAVMCGVSASQIDDIYPCTPLQEGLVALMAKRPGQYMATFEYSLADHVNLDQFKSAWEQTAMANTILRTRVSQTDQSGMLQVVVQETVSWHVFESEAAAKAGITQLSMGLGDRLVHFALIQPDPEAGTFKFFLTLHHAVYDGSSLSKIWEQAQSAYEGKSLSPTPFSRFVHHILQSSGAEEYWESEFHGLSAPIFPALPSAWYMPNPKSSFVHKIPAFASTSTNYTASTTIRLAWAMVMSLFTDSEDVVFGLTVNGRVAPVPGIEGITGPTFATFPVRTMVRPSDTVEEALASVQRNFAESIPFQQLGMQNMTRRGGVLARACDFQCHVAIQPPAHETANSLVADVTSKDGDYTAFSNYGLVLVCHLPGAGDSDIVVSVNYDNTMLDEALARRMLQQFEHMVFQLSRTETQALRVKDLDLVNPHDRNQLERWNAVVPAGATSCLHELVLQHATTSPNAPAISAWDGDLTYKELDTESAILAQQLQSLGIKHGSLVPVVMNRSKWVIVSWVAIHRIGAACVNVDPKHPRERIREMLDRTSASHMLTCSDLKEDMFFDGTTLITVPIPGQQPPAVGFAAPPVNTHDTAFVIFTSGSTGKPKAILMEHVNLATSVIGFRETARLDNTSRVMHFASYAFDASIYEVFGALISGGCICIPSESDRNQSIVDFVREHRVNWAIFTPSYLSFLEPASVPSIRTILAGGEPITKANVRTWAPHVNFFSGYGPAEATICTVGPLLENVWKQGDLGHMNGGVGWIVLPNDPTRLAPVGAPGELVIEGAVVTRGYLNDPEKTAAAFIKSPPWLRQFRGKGSDATLYRSGDLVQYNQDGTLRFLGRRDTQVKLRGQRIELGEVEFNVRQAFPHVMDVVAEVVTPAGGRPTLVAFVANSVSKSPPSGSLFEPLNDEFSAQCQAASRKLRRTLPDYMVPAAFLQLSRIVRNSSDKADRKLLKQEAAALSPEQLHRSSSASSTKKREPETSREKLLQSLWSEVLNVPLDEIGADDEFFQIGGDSIAAMRLAASARRRNVHLNVAEVFQSLSLCELSEKMEMLGAAAGDDGYSPGSLVGTGNVARFFSDQLASVAPGLSPDQVEDVLPITELQRSLLQCNNTAYSSLYLGTHVDLQRLEAACQALVRKHAILRTVFVAQGKDMLQVVLREAHFSIETHSVDEDLWESSDRLCSEDYSSAAVFGQLYFKPILVSNKQAGHILIIRMNHAQYDAGSFPLVTGDLTTAYGGDDLQPVASSFAQYLHYRASQRCDRVYDFWREYLRGSEVTKLSSLGMDSQRAMIGTPEILGKYSRQIQIPALPEGITLGTLVKAAWAINLSRRAKRTDIVFGHIINGRDAPLQDIDKLSGPCITISPFRVTFQKDWTVRRLLEHVQRQYTRSMPFANIDLVDIVEHATDWAPDTTLSSVLTHQDASLNVQDVSEHATDSATDPLLGSALIPQGANSSKEQWKITQLGIDPYFHVVTFPMGRKLKVVMAVSNRQVAKRDGEEMISQFCELIQQITMESANLVGDVLRG